MNTLTAFIFVFGILLFPFALLFPAFFGKPFKTTSRKKLTVIYSSVILLSFILFALTSNDRTEKRNEANRQSIEDRINPPTYERDGPLLTEDEARLLQEIELEVSD